MRNYSNVGLRPCSEQVLNPTWMRTSTRRCLCVHLLWRATGDRRSAGRSTNHVKRSSGRGGESAALQGIHCRRSVQRWRKSCECKSLKKRQNGVINGPKAPEYAMKISVQPDGWGQAQPRDIKAVLTDTASHINRLLSAGVTEHVYVIPAAETDRTPRTHFRRSPNGPIFIQLTARNTKWAQFVYQFAHEFCHVVSDYERLENDPNNWFHEALCELASVFTLQRMAATWSTQPPYPNWADYAGSLASYAYDLLSDRQRQLPPDRTIAAWLSDHEEELRGDPYLSPNPPKGCSRAGQGRDERLGKELQSLDA